MAVPNTQIEAHSAIGTRIHVIGNSTSGKSTLGARLAEELDATFVELDAINWQPGWGRPQRDGSRRVGAPNSRGDPGRALSRRVP